MEVRRSWEASLVNCCWRATLSSREEIVPRFAESLELIPGLLDTDASGQVADADPDGRARHAIDWLEGACAEQISAECGEDHGRWQAPEHGVAEAIEDVELFGQRASKAETNGLPIEHNVVAHGAYGQRVDGGLCKAGFSAVGLRGPDDFVSRGAAKRKDTSAPRVVDLDKASVGSGGGVVLELDEPVASIALCLDSVQVAEEPGFAAQE
jgi:hypothetical protein